MLVMGNFLPLLIMFVLVVHCTAIGTSDSL